MDEEKVRRDADCDPTPPPPPQTRQAANVTFTAVKPILDVNIPLAEFWACDIDAEATLSQRMSMYVC